MNLVLVLLAVRGFAQRAYLAYARLSPLSIAVRKEPNIFIRIGQESPFRGGGGWAYC